MTNETRNRIQAYVQELPFMKEKIYGALLMLVIAAGVIVASTYAWVTLSRSPEVSEITTTLAANGALEIALSNPEGTVPEEFDIDESATGNTSVLVSNHQWGNLINLSDPAYGIDNLALRPAQLNTTSLLTSPLWGAVYGSDGRITNLDSNYAYAKYNGTQFLTSDEYGVRAIATYKAEISDATQQEYNDMVQAVATAHTAVNQSYENVAPKFAALGTMISKYAQNKLDDGYTDLAPYIINMLPLYQAVQAAMEAQMEAYVALANLQSYLYANETNGTYEPKTWDNLYQNRAQYNTASAGQDSKHGHISLVGLTQFITDYEKLLKDIEYLELYHADYTANKSPYYWGGYRMDGETKVTDNSVSGYTLSNIVDHLINYSTMTIDLDNNGTETKVTALGMDNAGSLLGANNKERSVYIHNGILFRLEQSSIDEAYRIKGKAACTIKVQYMMSITVYGKAHTKAAGACSFMENLADTQGTKLVANDAVAEDTYGLAIDLWVRTNVEETCLTLEGATSTDVQGNIVSYDGINRIWGATGEAVLTTDSTTQGGGSCYIYYADTPEDQARSLELLNAMKVAFVDSAGNLLATAEMDTAHPWEVNGRITVPLVLDSDTKTTYTYTDAENRTLTGYAVTTLYADATKRITAIVYLDGTRLTNEHVLAAAEIQGSLNIQFGSSNEIKTVGNNELIDDTRSVTAMADKYSLDYDTAVTDDDLTTTVTLNVEGTQPDRITAFFVRAINSTQGTREETMTFEKQADGSWIHEHKFAAPGVYYLRHVRLDGVDYTLHEPLVITVSGFALNNVTWSEAGDEITVRTSDSSYSVDVAASFATTDTRKMPVSVQIRFEREDGNTVTVPLSYHSSSGQWRGTADFSVSGIYTMKFLVYTIKGETIGRYQDLNSFQKTLDLSLGMYVTVSDMSGGLVEEYEDGKSYPKKVAVKVFNNAGASLEELTDLKLFYSNGASSTNTINTDLAWEWDELNGCYTGTLPIVSPGRYQFSSVKLGDQYLTLAKENPPVYTVVSPDPPIFDPDSVCTSNNDNGLQMVPLSNDAVISGLVIENSSAADVSVVVYSEVAQKYFTLSRSDGKVDVSDDTWTIDLPVYTLDLDEDGNPTANASYTQEGGWSLAAVMLSGCYDAGGEFRGSDKPIIWGGTDTASRNYLTGADLTADASYDFSALSTNVSTTVKVTVTPGTTALGGPDADFMTTFYTTDLDSYVTVTDNAGNVIPGSKVKNVKMTVSYTAPNTDKYGYKVLAAANKTYELLLNEYDAETGRYTVGGEGFWQYVGEYTVYNLSLTIGGVPQTYYFSDGIGLPERYTVETSGPNVDDINMTATQNVTMLGKTGNNVTGTFLQAYSPNIPVRFALTGVTGTNYVDMSSLVSDVDLVMTYENGKSAPNGGYSWVGTSPYENVSLPMSNSEGIYLPGSSSLLAGKYGVKVVAVVGENTIERELTDIEVHSKAPTLKITGVTPATSTSFIVDTNTDETKYYQYVTEEYGVRVQNYLSDAGDLANVYIGATANPHSYETESGPSTVDMVQYTLPKVTLQLGNLANSGFASAQVIVPNRANNTYAKTYTFTAAGLEQTSEIGGKETKVEQPSEAGGCDGVDVKLNYDVQYNAGEQKISTVSMKDSSDFEYAVTLEKPVTIREENVAPPAISYAAASGYNSFSGQVSETGDSFQVTLPTAEQFGTQTGETSEIVGGQGWGSPVSDTTSGKYCYVVTDGEVQTNSVGSGCNGTTNYKYYNFKYYQFVRHQYKYEQTSGTRFYSVVKGLTGWQIGDQVYAPGATITVDGVVTAIPVVGTLRQTFLREEVVTMVHTTVKDVPTDPPYSTSTGNTTAYTDEPSAKNDHTLPAGYIWYNNNNHFDATLVIVNETQDGEDYQKPTT